MNDSHTDWLDVKRCACLCDVGGGGYIAAVVIAADGRERLLMALRDAIGDDNVTYDGTCSDAAHEQLGPLPLEYVRRLTISRRHHLCGRPTKATGRPCRIEVTRPGEPCGLHRTPNPAKGTR